MRKVVLALIVLAVFAGVAWLILKNPPEGQRGGPPPARAMSVEVFELARSAYQVQLASFGTVAPSTQTVLIAQVGGQILEVSDNFADGGFFSKGDVLLVLDPRDFEVNVAINEASVADAQQSIEEEQARAEQAARDWKRLGNTGEPSALVLRAPQLAAAEARLASARATLDGARLALERATVRAPYDGRVLQQRVDLGQVVNAGTQLADIYATDFVEVRLPLRNADLKFFDLPEGSSDLEYLPDVEIISELGEPETWLGKIVRTEGAIDATARQLHVIAQIDEPFSATAGKRPLKIGEYVTARLAGRQLADARVVPVEAIYQNSFVYVVEEGVLARRNVTIDWQNEIETLVSNGVEFGDQIVTTPMGQVTSGLPVRLLGEKKRTTRGDERGKERRTAAQSSQTTAETSPAGDAQ